MICIHVNVGVIVRTAAGRWRGGQAVYRPAACSCCYGNALIYLPCGRPSVALQWAYIQAFFGSVLRFPGSHSLHESLSELVSCRAALRPCLIMAPWGLPNAAASGRTPPERDRAARRAPASGLRVYRRRRFAEAFCVSSSVHYAGDGDDRLFTVRCLAFVRSTRHFEATLTFYDPK